MIRDIFLVLLVVLGAVWTYQIKHEAERSARRVADLRSAISVQEDKIKLLEADWAILTSPGRLESTARLYSDDLSLEPLLPSQIVTLDDLPFLFSSGSDTDPDIEGLLSEESSQ